MIIGFEGGLGSGKTLIMTRYLVKDQSKGRNVFANYGLRGIEYEKLDMEKLVRNELDLRNASVGIDEITLYMDSRSSMGNKLISYFVLQTRKRNVCLYYTTQNISMVDRRLREHTQIFVFCKDVGKEHHRFYQLLDYRYGKYAKMQRFFLHIRPWYKYYDTDEVLSPIIKGRNIQYDAIRDERVSRQRPQRSVNHNSVGDEDTAGKQADGPTKDWQ